MAEAAAPQTFSAKVIAAVVVGAALAFLGFLFLMAYAPQLKRGVGDGVHPMSKAAVGFYGLYHLAEETGRPVALGDREALWRTPGFVIVTIDQNTDAARLRKLIAARRDVARSVTLYIMPKWVTASLFGHAHWVQSLDDLPPAFADSAAEPLGRLKFGTAIDGAAGRIHGVAKGELPGVEVAQPRRPHFLVSGAKPVLVDEQGRTVLGRNDVGEDIREYVLADPDIMSNQGLKSLAGARAALQIVDAMRADENDSVAFDLALNGERDARNLLQLMFEPPFLALTLAVLAAALLVGIHAFGRFGPPVAEPRALPFGKRALADNAAVLIGRAGAVKRMGDRYVALIRDSVTVRLGATALDNDALERWLAALPGVRGPDFATLAKNARTARDAEGVRAAAHALHNWRNEVVGDR